MQVRTVDYLTVASTTTVIPAQVAIHRLCFTQGYKISTRLTLATQEEFGYMLSHARPHSPAKTHRHPQAQSIRRASH